MKILEYFVISTLLSVAICRPLNMICMPMCNTNITATVKFVNEWMNDSSNAIGINQLRDHTDTVVYRLLRDVDSGVS